MNFIIRFEKQATKEIARLKKHEPQAYKKLIRLLEELQIHPQEGTGHPEQLKWMKGFIWSRKITGRHRLVYQIIEEKVLVLVLSAYGHYDDK